MLASRPRFLSEDRTRSPFAVAVRLAAQKIELVFSCQSQKLINGSIGSLRSGAQSASGRIWITAPSVDDAVGEVGHGSKLEFAKRAIMKVSAQADAAAGDLANEFQAAQQLPTTRRSTRRN